ncbi:MAG: ROK family transcriptional regulator [Actinomycetota bacterium]
MNERTVLEFIRERGPVSRAQLARDSGLSKPTVSQALTALTDADLVREAGRSSGGKGPAAILYELNPGAGWVIGLDVGAARVRGAIANLTGEIVARTDEGARSSRAKTLIQQVAETARALAAEARVPRRRLSYVVVGSPGVFEPSTGHVAMAHNLPGWGRQGLFDELRKMLGVPMRFENDVNLATIGERWHGLGKGVGNFAYLHVGTGVGLGLVLHGELYRGSHGAAGEVAYLPLSTTDPHDRAVRKSGALEAALGADGVVDAARAAGMRGELTPRSIFDTARKGDARAVDVVGTVARRVALAIAAIAPIIDPELVIVGGGIGRNGDLLLEAVERELHAISPFHPRIESSVLGADAELHGAVSMALEAAQDRLFARSSPRGGGP